MNHSRASKRRRRRPPLHFHSVTAAEERFLQQAIQNSKLDKGRPADGKLSLPAGPVFYPTVEDFEGNPLHYVEKIRPIAERYGICKIVPPAGWNPAPCIDIHSKKKFQTKHQLLHRLQEGISFGDGQDYNVADYQKVASERAIEWKTTNYPDHDLLSRHADVVDQADSAATSSKCFTPENLERDYWDIVETHSKQVDVEYANDIDTQEFGSGFPQSERGRSTYGTKNLEKMSQPEPKFGEKDYYKESWWNLNNIPCAPDSVLRHVRVGINGINVPWMYYGSLFTTFCWHNEDNHLYSINYHHKGAPKQWYGVPGTKDAADGLEKVFKSYLSMKMRDVPDLLHHITTMFSPRLLQNADVPVSKLIQYEGEFIITFPRAFHGGFSYGPNVGEAVNFATHDWIAYGSDANERYRSFARPAVFSHDRLTFTMANHLVEQNAYSTCKLLLDELERVVEEELRLRQRLLESGVRDVSSYITLPKNRLDQLDENSANYDDKRLCHACKHVCFFSAVACECSQSKVSCLRHSHYMCRCPTDRKYFMIWSNEKELKSTLERVRTHCAALEQTDEGELAKATKANQEPLPEMAPGAERDAAMHKGDEIATMLNLSESYRASKKNDTKPVVSPHTAPSHESLSRKVSATPSDGASASTSASTNSGAVDESAFAHAEDDDEIEIILTKGPTV